MRRNCWFTLSMSVVVAMFAGAARAEDGGRNGAVRLVKTIPVPGHMVVFDISFVDPATQLYYLADRSHKVIDVIDAKRDVFVKQIAGGFKGFTGNNDTSGPNGVVVSGKFLFVTDANSRIVTIDLTTDKIVSEVSTGGAPGLRADELAYDPEDGLLLPVNNADDPPFATLIKVDKKTGKLAVLNRITFANATNGAEQPVWDAGTGKFYISIPELNHDVSDGAVGRISTKGVLETLFHVKNCQPAGLSLGPRQDLLLGCSAVFDTAGNPWTSASPTTAAPSQVIMDAKTGKIDRVVPGVGGSDEVWFNEGDGRYYTASRNNPGGPVLGVIDAEDQTLVQVVPTFNTPASSPPPRGTTHSVAANPHNNHVFVPLPANNVFPACLDGCIAVFGAPRDD
ncbi:MAG TPA: hypothetical protein VK233_09210 [Candidatus Dormibacteraeota bacterium]|nr:hypothetical protein [Candidatus Dormibacteraeota bacterium]